MSKKNQDTAISRVMLMFVGCGALGVLAYLYYLPQKLQTYVVNNYRDTIELVAMISASVLFVASLVYAYLSRKKDKSGKIITPAMLCLLTLFAAAFSFVIPLSGDRGTYSTVAIMSAAFLFVAYITYHFVNRSFAYQSVVFGIYVLLIYLYSKYFSGNVTFNVKIALDHNVARILFSIVIVLLILISVLAARKRPQLKPWHTALLSMVPAGMLIARFFVIEYVSLISYIVITVVFIALVVLTKIFKK